MSREQLERMPVLAMSSMVFSSLAAPPEVAKRARRCGEPAVTGCIALGEAAAMAKFLEPFARSEYQEAYTALEEDLEFLPCTTSLAREIWARGITAEDLQEGQDDTPEWARVRRGVPSVFFGPRIAGTLLAISTTSLKRLKEFRSSLEAKRLDAGP